MLEQLIALREHTRKVQAELDSAKAKTETIVGHLSALIEIQQQVGDGTCKHEKRESLGGFGPSSGLFKCLEPGCGVEFHP